jgi:branched-chain amino acid transport system permease protein
MNFIWNALILINIYALLGLANNLTVGYAGLLNLAIAASFAIGSYSVAVLMVKFSFGFWMAICGAVFISVVMAFIIGAGTLRYKRTSFALASLAFQILVLSILQNTDFAGGMLGIHNIGISFRFLVFVICHSGHNHNIFPGCSPFPMGTGSPGLP